MERAIILTAHEVRSVLNGTKTQHRVRVKPQPVHVVPFIGRDNKPTHEFGLCLEFERVINKHVVSPFGVPGDRLWVRETVWRSECGKYYVHDADRKAMPTVYSQDCVFIGDVKNEPNQPATISAQVASYSNEGRGKWTNGLVRLDTAIPIVAFTGNAILWQDDAVFRRKVASTQMPRWASRITVVNESVRVQRVQDISEEDARAEGVDEFPIRIQDQNGRIKPAVYHRLGESCRDAYQRKHLTRYGADSWSRNDWVFALTFKRMEGK